MNMVCASTYLYILQYLSSVSYDFLTTGVLHPWLCLFIGILFFFVAIVNGIVYLISLSVLYCQIKIATDFWILILYPTLLNSFISSISFSVESLGFSRYSIMSSTNNDHFTSFQFDCLLFLLLF